MNSILLWDTLCKHMHSASHTEDVDNNLLQTETNLRKLASSPSLPIALLSCHFYIPFLLMDRSVPATAAISLPNSTVNYPLYCRTLACNHRCDEQMTTYNWYTSIVKPLWTYLHAYTYNTPTYIQAQPQTISCSNTRHSYWHAYVPHMFLMGLVISLPQTIPNSMVHRHCIKIVVMHQGYYITLQEWISFFNSHVL